MEHAYVSNASFLPIVYNRPLWGFVIDHNHYDKLQTQRVYAQSFAYKKHIQDYLEHKTTSLPPVTLLLPAEEFIDTYF